MSIGSRCSAEARANAADPLGSATAAVGGYLLVEFSPPWPSAIEDVPGIAQIVAKARERSTRVLLVTDSQRRRPTAELAVTRYARPLESGHYGPYRRAELVATREALLDAALELLDRDPTTGVAGRDIVDVLICTHGSRDVCCGADGTRLHDQLSQYVGSSPSIRLWRSSHQGGHRFAPTMLVLPDGTSWGHLDAPTANAIVNRSAPAREVTAHLRGTTSLASGGPMLVDRLAMDDADWVWCDAQRIVAIGPGDLVEVRSSTDDTMWSGTVERLDLPIRASCRNTEPTSLTATWRLRR